ncbi:MAG: hypothetical protein Kow0069_10130 [Promethearchaeota archaeon]
MDLLRASWRRRALGRTRADPAAAGRRAERGASPSSLEAPADGAGGAGDAPLVFNVQKFSTEDGPGIRTTVFFKGCPLSCAWCHNPEGIDPRPQVQWLSAKCIACRTCVRACPSAAISFDEARGVVVDRSSCRRCGACATECPSTALELVGRRVPVEELFEEVRKDAAFYETSGGGVTCSGGEPTLQFSALLAFVRRCKEGGLHVALDTCGVAPREKFERLLPFVDLFLYDLKLMDPELHRRYCGTGNEQVLRNARFLSEQGAATWVRTPLVPGHTATPENVRAIGRFIAENLPTVERWDLCAFLNLCRAKYERLGLDWALKDVELMEAGELDRLVEVARESGVTCEVAWSGMARRARGTGVAARAGSQ